MYSLADVPAGRSDDCITYLIRPVSLSWGVCVSLYGCVRESNPNPKCVLKERNEHKFKEKDAL